MKIVHIHFGKDGGAERFFVNLVNSFHRRGVEQRIFMRPGRSWRKDVEACGIIYEGTYNRISLSRFMLAARRNRVLREFQPDVIMSWQLRASRFMPAYDAAYKVSRLGDYPEHLGYYKNSDALVCITPDIARKVKEFGWQGGLEVIANFTSARPCPPISRAELGTPEDAFLVVAMGRFVKRKGFDDLIRAVAKLEGVYLWVLGDGPERTALESLAALERIHDRVRFPGWQTDAYRFLAAADAFAITSLHEPLGNVCLEGWGAKKPTVATKAEGPRWVMRDEFDALLVEPGDSDGIAAAIQRLKSDPILRQSLVEGGTRTLEERFSEAAVTDAYFKLFAERPT